jgi:hypothetical protein
MRRTRLSKSFWTLLAASFMAACSATTSGGNNAGQPDDKTKPNPTPVGYAFKTVDVPADMKALLPEGMYKAVAYQAPSGKTVSIAFSDKQSAIVVARYANGVLDASFGTNGSSRFEFMTTHVAVGDPKLAAVNDLIVMAGTVANSNSIGFYAALFDLEGNFKKDAYKQGSAWSAVWIKPNSGVYCSKRYLETTGIKVNGTEVDVHGKYSTICSDTVTDVIRRFNTVKPELTHLQATIPASCENYNYKSPGAVNSQSHKLVQTGCSSIDFEFVTLGWSSAQTETFSFTTDGKCFDSKRFGRSCFVYENGYLTRVFVDTAWRLKKEYFAVVKATGSLCGVSGPSETYFVASYYPPTDPMFRQDCRYY